MEFKISWLHLPVLLSCSVLLLSACAPAPTATPLPTASATVTATRTLSPTPSPSPTATSTSTPQPTATPDAQKQLVDFLNSSAAPQTLSQYSTAEGLNISDAQSRLQDPKADVTLKDSKGSPFEVLVDTQTQTPLFIKENGAWREVTWKDEGEKANLPIGTILDFGDNGSKLPSYKVLGGEQFNFITLSGSVYEKWWKNGGMDYWTIFAHANNLPVSINPVFFHDDIYNIENPTPDNVRGFMKNRLRKILNYAALPKNDPHQIKLSSIVLANEPFVVYNGNIIWQGSPVSNMDYPLYRAFGQNWITEAYICMDQVARELGLTPGKDFRVIGVNLAIINQAESDTIVRVEKDIGQRLGIPWQQVPFDIGEEHHLGNTSGQRNTTVPLDQIEVNKLIAHYQDIARAVSSTVFITELDGLYPDEKLLAEKIGDVITAAGESGVVQGINLFRALNLSDPNDPWKQNGFFAPPDHSKRVYFYSILKAYSQLLKR